MEKYARQALSEGLKTAEDLHVAGDSELYRVLNLHYNRNNHIEVRVFWLETFEESSMGNTEYWVWKNQPKTQYSVALLNKNCYCGNSKYEEGLVWTYQADELTNVGQNGYAMVAWNATVDAVVDSKYGGSGRLSSSLASNCTIWQYVKWIREGMSPAVGCELTNSTALVSF